MTHFFLVVGSLALAVGMSACGGDIVPHLAPGSGGSAATGSAMGGPAGATNGGGGSAGTVGSARGGGSGSGNGAGGAAGTVGDPHGIDASGGTAGAADAATDAWDGTSGALDATAEPRDGTMDRIGDSDSADAGAENDGGGVCVQSTFDLKSTAGIDWYSQSFNETRAIRVVPAIDVAVSALIIEGLNLNSPGTVGARIYDAETQGLLASANANVTVGAGVTVSVNIGATLIAAKSYMIGFFVDAGGSSSAHLFEPSVLPYAVGPFSISAIGEAGSDGYPASTNLVAPLISIRLCSNGEEGGATDASGNDGD